MKAFHLCVCVSIHAGVVKLLARESAEHLAATTFRPGLAPNAAGSHDCEHAQKSARPIQHF
jgi:hypothetical protein